MAGPDPLGRGSVALSAAADDDRLARAKRDRLGATGGAARPRGGVTTSGVTAGDLNPDVTIDLRDGEAAARPEPQIRSEVADIPAMLDALGRPVDRPAHRVVMRSLDLVISLALLIVSAPVILVIAIVIVIDSRGPAVFKQLRVGRDGHLFHFYKFRTMYVDARERFPDFYAYDHTEDDLDTLFFKHADDPRLTRVGAKLRRTSLDELPNFINVVKGDMSLVGPRPEIPEMVRWYQPEELLKFAAKPGVTGLAQISGRNILRFKETNAHDLDYIRRRSLRLDLQILGRTPGVVVGMIGAL